MRARRDAAAAAGLAGNLTAAEARGEEPEEEPFAGDVFVTRRNFHRRSVVAKEAYADPSIFPGEHPRLERHASCALVGNAGALLMRTHGTRIDR